MTKKCIIGPPPYKCRDEIDRGPNIYYIFRYLLPQSSIVPILRVPCILLLASLACLLLACCLLVVVALNVYEYATRSFVRYAKLSHHLWLSTPYLHLDILYDSHIFSNKMPATLCLCRGNVFDLSWTDTRLQAMAPYKQDSGKIHGLHRDMVFHCRISYLKLNLTFFLPTLRVHCKPFLPRHG